MDVVREAAGAVVEGQLQHGGPLLLAEHDVPRATQVVHDQGADGGIRGEAEAQRELARGHGGAQTVVERDAVFVGAGLFGGVAEGHGPGPAVRIGIRVEARHELEVPRSPIHGLGRWDVANAWSAGRFSGSTLWAW